MYIVFPFNYYESESLKDEERNCRIRVIYVTYFRYLTITFTWIPLAGQARIPFFVTPNERLVISEYRTVQKEFLLNVRGGENDISEFIIKILLIQIMSQNCKPTEGFQPAFRKYGSKATKSTNCAKSTRKPIK